MNPSKLVCAVLILTVGLSLRVLAQVTFDLSYSAPGPSQSYWIATADVNGDGLVDIINGNYNVNNLTVFTNSGNGIFSLSSVPSVGIEPFAVAAADFNGDAYADLACANIGDHTLTVLTNDSHGNFVSSSAPNLGANVRYVVTADLNRDGKLDLICSGMSGTVTVLTNMDGGNFGLSAAYNLGSTEVNPVAADINSDGYVDLICAKIYDQTLTVLTNNGGGVLSSNASYTVGQGTIYALIAADVTGDGKPDLITANFDQDSLSVFTNNGSGVFSLSAIYKVGSGPTWIAATDVNGDGKLDLVDVDFKVNSLTVLTNDGQGGFSIAATIPMPYQPVRVEAADVNGDGKPDLICSFQNATTLVSVLTNSTQFPPATVPVVNVQPVSQTNVLGPGVILSVGFTAQGPQLYTYQWQFNGTNLPSATNNPLVLPNLTLDETGNYDLVIANAAGSVTSAVALGEHVTEYHHTIHWSRDYLGETSFFISGRSWFGATGIPVVFQRCADRGRKRRHAKFH